jgi:mannose-6-phosphate isomerase-like protein (cupin superfamily)
MKFHVTMPEAIAKLENAAKPFIEVMRHGSMLVEYYAPKVVDKQQPHSRDELYVIASGTGQFVRNGEVVFFSTGDVLFVPAGMEHRFQNFSEDFATWVIFYGESGGEKI